MGIYMFIHIYLFIYIYTHMYIYVHIYINTYINAYKCKYIYLAARLFHSEVLGAAVVRVDGGAL